MVPQAASFSGHESFPFRHTWLTKGVVACERDPEIFRSDEAMAVLGVGKNMVRSIRHWCMATGVVEEVPSKGNGRYDWQPSELGRRMFLGAGREQAWDPYLEDGGTLWLVHWLLATNAEGATTWWYGFGEIHQPTFSRDGLLKGLAELADRCGSRISRNTIARDVDIFLRSYARQHSRKAEVLEDSLDCPLVELGLIRALPERGFFSFNRGPKPTLPAHMLWFALLSYASAGRPPKRTLGFDEVVYSPGSPGKVFKLDEASMADRLERIEELSEGAVVFSETAGLRQITLRDKTSGTDVLSDYYCNTYVPNL